MLLVDVLLQRPIAGEPSSRVCDYAELVVIREQNDRRVIIH
jgi:hypothetical protein